mmetsp:Transcript_27154/g.55336  ORF Transcript_27154/g.55336 Transcript_27154/m.55336 type:complete len:104 (+) Transcript_27154:126-437(+)
MFQAIALPILLETTVGGQYQGNFDTYGDQYYSKRWLGTHMMDYCNAGLGTRGEIKKCVQVGMSLNASGQREYVHELGKGCFPGVVLRAGGGRCHLPGWSQVDW